MTRRDRTVISVVAVIALIVVGWFVLVAPKRSEAGKLSTQITLAQRQLTVEQQAVAIGEAARREYNAYYSQLAQLSQAVPADDAVPQLIEQLQHAAGTTGVDFRSLALGGSGATATATTSAQATPGAAAAQPLPPGVVLGASGVPEEPFSLSFQGSFFHLTDFLGRLQRFVRATNKKVLVSGRLLTISSVSFGAGPKGFPQITAQIQATTYLVPQLLTAVQNAQ